MLASGLVDYGHGGAHCRERFDPQEVAQVVTSTRVVLNHLFDPKLVYTPPASKSGKGKHVP